MTESVTGVRGTESVKVHSAQLVWDIDKKIVRMRSYQTARGSIDYICDYCGRHRGKAKG